MIGASALQDGVFQGGAIANPAPSVAVETRSALQRVANRVGTVVFMPDETPQGYRLRAVSHETVPSDARFPGLGNRVAVRQTFYNETTFHSFDLLQVRGAPETDARIHTKWLIYSGVFPRLIENGDTYETVKRDGYDIALHSTLISGESAKELLRRLVPVRPR